MTPRIGSLFSGYGGLDMAVQAVYGGEVAWYSEIDKHACQVLAAHHPSVPNLGDITAVDCATVPPIDILTGGYPCQPFSHAGKRAGTNDERHLWPFVRDAIATLRPVVTVLENVDGHRSLGLDVVLGDLAAMGVSARWGVVRAADAGAPHGRKRVFIVVAQPDQQGPQGADARLDVAARWSDAGGHAAQGDHVTAADAISERHHGLGDCRGEGCSECGRGDAAGPASTAADADSERHGGWQGPTEVGGMGSAAEVGRWTTGPARQESGTGSTETGADWGKYAPAITRWESVLGRPAPSPTIPGRNGRPRLSPVFVEWMMGLPAGHVTGHDLTPAAELKMLGNGVCPQQAELALRMLAVAA